MAPRGFPIFFQDRCMTDYFALFGETRRPWLDPEKLKDKFLAFTAQVHPDRVHEATEAEKQAANVHYTELNAAYNCLRESKTRLLHLLELERGTRPEKVQPIPSETMELFTEVGQLCREADLILADKAKATSPLLKVELFARGMALAEKLNALQRKLSVRREALEEQMKILNLAWESAPPIGSLARVKVLPCARLEHIYRQFSYLTRWCQQLQERVLRLSF
jgi:DnaJ-domain-containing protein 1